jgi:hypothetical protein
MCFDGPHSHYVGQFKESDVLVSFLSKFLS